MAKDINIHVKTPGAQQAKQQLDTVGEASRKVGDKARRGGQEGAKGMKQLEQATGSTKGRFTDLLKSVGSFVLKATAISAVISTITALINAQSKAMKEHAEIAKAQQQSLLRLQYLGSLFEERPELRKEVAAYAESGRRPFEEVADAWYNLRSKGAGLTKQQKDSIMREALELGRTDPTLPLNTLIDMFSLYAKKTSEQDANRIQNVLIKTITEAGGSGADVAKYMPQFLPLGMGGGLTGAQAAGLWAYATTQTAEASLATTGLTRTFAGLQGRGTPESKEILQKLGITPEMDFFDKIDILSGQYKTGKFRLAEAQLLAGQEGAAILLSFLQNPEAMRKTMEAVVAANRPDIDITGDMIRKLMGTDVIARTEEQGRQYDIALKNIKARDFNALEWENLLTEYELGDRQAGASEYKIAYRLWVLNRLRKSGIPAGFARRHLTPFRPEARQQLKEQDTLIESELPGDKAPTTINYNYHQDIIHYPRVGLEDGPGPRVDNDIQ